MHWQHKRYFGHAKDMAETAVKAEKAMKKFNKKNSCCLLVFFQMKYKAKFQNPKLTKKTLSHNVSL